MTFISYAQNFEDVMLWRALKHVEKGFYVDVGAQDPVVDSVSLAFYERGWRGVHIEPTPHYAERLREQRPDELVIQAAVGAAAGTIVFFEVPGTGLSTGDPEIAKRHHKEGFEVRETAVPCLTITQALKPYIDRQIHWMKIDIEGFERQVIEGWDGENIRPWVLVIESTAPLTTEENYGNWEFMILERGYESVYFDGLNRYYVSTGHRELLEKFDRPPNLFDDFTLSGTQSAPFTTLLNARLAAREGELDQVQQQLVARDAELAQTQQQLAARDADVAQTRQQLAARYAELGQTHQQLAARNAELTQTQQQLAARDAELTQTQQQLAARDAELAQTQQQLAARMPSSLRPNSNSPPVTPSLPRPNSNSPLGMPSLPRPSNSFRQRKLVSRPSFRARHGD